MSVSVFDRNHASYERSTPIRTAEILCVGTELLLGDIVNTNAAYLSRRLAGLGIAVYHQTVIGDHPDRLRAALNADAGRAMAVEALLPYIRAELEAFAQDAEQADDITMLGLTYHGPKTGGEA